MNLLILFVVLDEAQNIEMLDLSAREETVDSILLVGKHLENGVQFGEEQQFDIALVQVQQLQISTETRSMSISTSMREPTAAPATPILGKRLCFMACGQSLASRHPTASRNGLRMGGNWEEYSMRAPARPSVRGRRSGRRFVWLDTRGFS